MFNARQWQLQTVEREIERSLFQLFKRERGWLLTLSLRGVALFRIQIQRRGGWGQWLMGDDLGVAGPGGAQGAANRWKMDVGTSIFWRLMARDPSSFSAADASASNFICVCTERHQYIYSLSLGARKGERAHTQRGHYQVRGARKVRLGEVCGKVRC